MVLKNIPTYGAMILIYLHALIGVAVSFSATSTTTTTVTNKPKYVTRINKPTEILTTSYNGLVESAFIRHILVETKEMSSLVYDMLYANSTALEKNIESFDTTTTGDVDGVGAIFADNQKRLRDPFGYIASKISTCDGSKSEDGSIGWIDNPFYEGTDESINDIGHPLLPQNVIDEIFQKQLKGGDVMTTESERGVHLIRIEDLLVKHQSKSSEKILSSQNKVITSRKKLSGKGIIPKTPFILSENSNDNENTKPVAEKYTLLTNGCQMNVADSERMEGILQDNLNLENAPNTKDANVVVINTCSIRDHAESKLYDQLGPLAQRKRNGEHLALVVTGCVAQQEGEALVKKFPEVDAVMGPQYANRLGDILDDVSRGHQVIATDPTLITEDISRPVRTSNVRAWVNVIFGCNEHCTYCVVPFTRGVEQSRSMENIAKEIIELGEEGYKEVTLLGQNIDAYGRDMTPKRTFADLLIFLNEAIEGCGVERIRYVTSHPRYFSDRVIDAVSDLDKVCECFHMPFQSGDDTVLKNMRRGYTFDSYMKIIDKIKAKSPDASITGDVIVGFPGETEEQFERTLELMNRVKFDNLNTFAYSPRPNTEASDWTNQVPDEIKDERLQKVQRLALQHATERSRRFLDKEVEVLVEERNPKNPNQVMGRVRQSRMIFFDGKIDELLGKLVMVKVTETRPWSLSGVLTKVL
eukprot:CAMPEP_0178952338 /NCGR_PEP_ID=MMETSP0789-20121207/7751_1 /TAXON_ID=3005 /ORGANISM="Rhizosolenia setigera, Strain CCMP 1694" /LENGTH=697 /DNA_ID=CAMNT_0020633361 /DNA_START=567 /DNA_END=2660 /DNA_ORIENTATION=+